MNLYIIGCVVIICGGWLALLFKHDRLSFYAANAGLWVGVALVSLPVISVLSGKGLEKLSFTWTVPGGSFGFGLDALSAFFCLPVLLIAPLAMVYGRAYLYSNIKTPGSHWFFYNLLSASMLLLMVATNGLLFLVVWEIMALSSFFLVMYDDAKAEVREAGWTYLIATHIGTVALLLFFGILGFKAGSLDFERVVALTLPNLTIGVLFVLAMLGFGVKAGFFPLHVWLPEAHPAAPSHISALMSGVMIKTGIYGLLRALYLIHQPSVYIGWTLVIVGVVSGVGGLLFAIAQQDLKRLLAYSSVENIGIITLGLGVGVLGLAWNIPALAFLGFGGGLLHVLNHAVMKSLLFLTAGSVAHSTGTRNMKLLGGLFKRARVTGFAFLLGATAISGLPPFNGFISEFYIYSAVINGIRTATPGPVILAACVLPCLALIGGLAVACFSKAFGIVFLGEARSKLASEAHEAGKMMLVPMLVLCLLSILIGLLAPLTIFIIFPPVQVLMGANLNIGSVSYATAQVLSVIALIISGLVVLAALLYLLRRTLPRAKEQSTSGTWDCGYAEPTARMQYTASSYVEPITDMFSSILQTKKSGKEVGSYFPEQASLKTETPDVAKVKLIAPIFELLSRLLAPIRKVQHGNLNGYLLYIAITLIVLLVWKTGVQP